MHMDIYVIISAEDEKEAIGNAEQIFAGLCNSTIFDYYSIEDTPIKVISTEGQALIKDIINIMKDDFQETMKYLRHFLNWNNDDIWNDGAMLSDLRHWCYRIGQYAGPCVPVYDDDGEGLRSPAQLRPYQNINAGADHLASYYIVTADVHF